MTGRSGDLEAARQEVRLSREDLYWRYFALGGSVAREAVERYLDGQVEVWSPAEVNILTQALNERYAEIGLSAQVPYVNH
jgi:hypothetical protein